MKTEQEVRETRDRISAVVDRMANAADLDLGAIDLLRLAATSSQLAHVCTGLSWALGEAEEVPEDAKGEGYHTLHGLLLEVETFINHLYTRSRDQNAARSRR
jgi:hypothetical protein